MVITICRAIAIITAVILSIAIAGILIAKIKGLEGWFVFCADFSDSLSGLGVEVGYTPIGNNIQLSIGLLKYTLFIGYSLNPYDYDEEVFE